MTTFSDIKTSLISIINRKDITDALAATFVQQAQLRLERTPTLRPTWLEVDDTLTVDDAGEATIPSDILELSAIYTEDGLLRQVDLKAFLEADTGPGIPRVFRRFGNTVRLRPLPSDDTTSVSILYYAKQTPLDDISDTNNWLTYAADLMLYGAAIFACNYFEDERAALFSGLYDGFVQELVDQTVSENMAGHTRIEPSYNYQDECP